MFGILNNASRQRLRRGQNRLPGLVMASLIAAIKISVYNEEQLRGWVNGVSAKTCRSKILGSRL